MHYPKVAALRGVGMDVPHGSVITVIGANGAGKSTLLRAVSGLERLSPAFLTSARLRTRIGRQGLR